MKNMNLDGLKKEKVREDLFVYTSSNHKFGTDSFLISNFAAPRNKDVVCDFGTGCGIISILLHRDFSPKKIYAIDIQEEAVWLAKKSVECSNLNDRVIVRQGDIRKICDVVSESVDVVVCNPPYKDVGRGILSKKESDKIARHEVFCKIDDVCFAANKILKFGGRLCMCQRAERLADTICSMRAHNIEPKVIRFCAKNNMSSPWMFLIEGKKGSKPFLKVMSTVGMYDENGDISDEMKLIYGLGGVKF